ncbi:hypothetical protein GCM10009665_67720 [Kitasatospora nipponensis]|uniref:Uncharacterized protein n=1 Tax=Kitasatospora nipponensis TaxID=258049 RepID=A0ABP4HMX8_9ACTN
MPIPRPTCATESPIERMKKSAAVSMNILLPIMLTKLTSASTRRGPGSGINPRETHQEDLRDWSSGDRFEVGVVSTCKMAIRVGYCPDAWRVRLFDHARTRASVAPLR